MTTVSDMVVAVHVAMSSAMHAMTTVSDMPTGRERRTSTAGVAYDALSVSQGSATGVGARTSPSAGKGAGAGLGVGSRGAKLKVRRSKTTWWPTVAECHRRSGDRRPPRPRPPRSSSSRCSSASSSPPPSRPLSWLLLTSLRAVWLSLCVAQVEGHSGHRYGDVDYFPPTKFPVVVRTAPLQHSDTSLSPARRDGTRTRSTTTAPPGHAATKLPHRQTNPPAPPPQNRHQPARLNPRSRRCRRPHQTTMRRWSPLWWCLAWWWVSLP